VPLTNEPFFVLINEERRLSILDIDDLLQELENYHTIVTICRENYRLAYRRIGRDLSRAFARRLLDDKAEKIFAERYLDCVRLFVSQLRPLAIWVGDMWQEIERPHFRTPAVVVARNLLIDLDKRIEFYLDRTGRLENKLILYLEEGGFLRPPAD